MHGGMATVSSCCDLGVLAVDVGYGGIVSNVYKSHECRTSIIFMLFVVAAVYV